MLDGGACITRGDNNEVQKIYEHGLFSLSRENKLQITDVKGIVYFHHNGNYNYQIKSFTAKGMDPFNEFRIIPKNSNIRNSIILVDYRK